MARRACILTGLLLGFVAAPLMADPVTNGLVLWLDAQDIDGDGNPANNPADGTLVGTALTPWVDKAPLQGLQNATQSTSGLQPTYWSNGQNGQAVVRFDGNDLLAAPSLAFGTFTYFAALRGNTGSVLVYERSANSNNYDGEYLCLTTNLTTNVRRAGVRSGHNLTPNYGADGKFRLTEHSFGGTDATHLLLLNGVLQTLTGGYSNNPGTASITDTLYIGDRPGLGLGLKGDLAELLVYNRVLTLAERNSVGMYLAGKYGLETAYVPEPGAVGLAGLGALGLAVFLAWRRSFGCRPG